MKIKTKGGLIVPFVFNPAQRIVHAAVEEQVRLGKPLRFIVLKARQEGVSTYFAGRIFHRTANRYNRKAGIIGHENKAANNLLEMCERFYNFLPDGIKPKVGHSNEKKLSFSTLQSEIIIASADSGEGLERSATYQDISATETSFWRDAKSSLNSLLQTVADDPNTMVVIESTANGVGGEFYDRWKAAEAGESGFTPIFLPWFAMPEYSRVFESEDKQVAFEKSLTDVEREISAIHSLTLEQMNWRRKTIADNCGGDEKLFQQEMPATPEEAFIASGRPVFNNDICNKNFVNSEKPINQGYLEYVGDEKRAVKFVENNRGYIKLFNKVELGQEVNRWVAGVDVAEGLEQGDYSVIPVFDRLNNKFSLIWHGHIEPDLLGEEMHKIQLYLGGDVWFLVERNNHGLTTILRARQLGVKLSYEERFDTGQSLSSDKIGMKTAGGDNFSTSKTILINDLDEAIRNARFESKEKEFWGECMTFVRNARGGMSAQGKDKDPSTKCFDDRVMATALAWRCHSWLPSYRDKATVKRVYRDIAEYKEETLFKPMRKRGKKVLADTL